MTMTAETKASVEAAEHWDTRHYGEIAIAFTEGIPGVTKRRYLVNGKTLPSVTTIIGKHIAKDGLKYWYESKAIEGMVAMFQETGEIPPDAETARRALWAYGLTAEQQRDQAGISGRIIHEALENWHQYQDVPDLSKIDAKARGKMRALIAWLGDTRPDILSSEVLVASVRFRYAGRYDARLTYHKDTPAVVQLTTDPENTDLRVIPAGTYLADVKSGNKLHQDTGVQLALYEQASIECGYEPTDGRFAIHLREDGTYAIHMYATQRDTATRMVEFYHAYNADNKAKTGLNKNLPKPERAA